MLGKIGSLHQKHPQASIFVISSNPSPDHIVEVMKAGASEFFMHPVNPEKIREAMNRVRLKLVEGGQKTIGRAFAFIGSKGGLGTTVLAVNTAVAMAAARGAQKTALVDLSLQSGDSSVLLDLVPKTTMADVVHNFSRFDPAFLAGVMEPSDVGVDLLAAPPSPEESAEVTGEQVARVLQACRRLYPLTAVDCPAMTLDERTMEALRGAQMVLVVTDLSVPAVRNAARLLKQLRRHEIPRVEVVVNRFVKGQSGTLEEVEKTLERRVFWLFPNDYETTIAATNRGTPLLKYDPRSPLARSIVEFAQKLQDASAFPNYRGVKGLLGKAI
ncbi:MAG: hypothetical protein IH614_14250 [Desulfuromonadales bacterium]|nr:hypothetical protein [Desulfuromonadales bacterium]